jgi:8-oxo-dGTP pyrophosphatase MutT (NUDIX family)
MIYLETPNNFSPKFQVVSCYVECQGKLLFLHRPIHKSQGGKWGVPAGKVEIGETIDLAIVRELKEETGLQIDLSQLQFLKKIAVKHPEHDFVYHMYRVKLNEFPNIKIDPTEHQDYKWATPQEALALDLVEDLDECIRMYY